MRNPRLAVALLAATLVGAGLLAAPPASGRATPAITDGRIAFRDGVTGQIYTVNPDGSALQQVTHLGKNAGAADPEWSPDGDYIAAGIFHPDEPGATLEVMKADGSDRHAVFKDD